MDNKSALFLALLIIILLLVDRFFLGWNIPVFLFEKLVNLIDEIAFWR